MYAVIETGGKQYRVEVGTELQVELLDVEPGKTIRLDRVLLVADGDTSSIGRPLVTDAAVRLVLPWSMWPIVPTLTWGLVRSNFFLAT